MYHDVIHDVSREMAEDEKKEKVIHTRVPESLEAELRKRASDLGISVSNLVRNVLGHAFGLVGDVVADSHAIARAARGDTKRKEVIGWQEIVAAKEMACPRCRNLIVKGARAMVALHDDGTTGAIECTQCAEDTR